MAHVFDISSTCAAAAPINAGGSRSAHARDRLAKRRRMSGLFSASPEMKFLLPRIWEGRLMSMVKAFSFGAALMISMPALAQGIPPVAAKVGKWEFRKGADGFSGKSECMLTLASNPRVQLSEDALYISYRGVGGVKGYRVRLDEGPVSEMILPTSIEEQTSAIGFTGAKFARIMQAKRLRIQALTYLDLKNDDIDLAGAAPLLARMRREC